MKAVLKYGKKFTPDDNHRESYKPPPALGSEQLETSEGELKQLMAVSKIGENISYPTI